jgi:hypothetical protein
VSIAAQGGTSISSIQHADRYSNSDSSSANTAIQQQPTSDPSGVVDSSLLQEITQIANDVLASRIEQGEKLKHDTLTGVDGHIDDQR